MTKVELVKALSEKSGKTLKEAGEFLTTFETVVGDTLKAGEDIKLKGFVDFTVSTKDVEAHEGRNPRTGEAVHVEAKTVTKAKAKISQSILK